MMQEVDDEAPQFEVGFRFQPSAVDVVEHYLRPRVVHGVRAPSYLIRELDVYRHDPWDLPRHPFKYSDGEMYFFSPRHHAGGCSRRANRIAGSGFWDGRSKDELIKKSGRVIGHKTQLTFKTVSQQNGRSNCKGESTDWLMHEFRLGYDGKFDDLVLCKIFKKIKAKQHGHCESESPSSSSSYPPCLVPQTTSDDQNEVVLPGSSPRPAEQGQDVCYVEITNSEEYYGSATAPQPLLMPQQPETVADDEDDFLIDVDIGSLASAWDQLGDIAFTFDELGGVRLVCD